MSERPRPNRHHFFAVLAVLRMAILLPAPFLAALDYGGVLPWTQWALTCAAVALLLLTIPEWLFGAKRRPNTSLLVTVCLVVAVGGLLQTYRLPSGLAAILSRGSHAAYTEIPAGLRAEAAASGAAELKALASPAVPISIAPSRTVAACTIPIVFAIFLIASACTFNNKGRLAALLLCLAVFGGTISFIGITNRLNPNSAQSQAQSSNKVVPSFVPFVNRNNAAVFLNLSLAATIGCLVWRYRGQRKLRPWDDRFDFDEATTLEAAKHRIQQFFNCMDTLIILFLILAGLILAGILIGGSRGGMLGMILGIVAVATRSVSQRQTQFFVIAAGMAMVLLVGLLIMLGSLDQVTDRTSSIWKEDFSETARWNHWLDAVPTAWKYLPAGAGLGTYRYAYLPYQNYSPGTWFQNADNLYLEMFVEGGLWLPLLLLLGTIAVVAAIWQLSSVKDSTTASAIVAASCYVVASVGVSQFFDFGALLPANYLTLAVLLGVLVGHADRRSYGWQLSTPRQRIGPSTHSLDSSESKSEKPQHTRTRVRIRKRRRKPKAERPDETSLFVMKAQGPFVRLFSASYISPVLSVLLLTFVVALNRDAKTRAEVDYWQRSSRLVTRDDAAGLLSLAPRLVRLETERPGDLDTQLALVQYRVVAVRGAAVRASIDRPSVLSPTPSAAWRNSDPRVIRAVFHGSQGADRGKAIAALMPDEDMETLKQARQNALSALLANPLDVTAREYLIQLDFLAPEVSVNDQLFEQMKRLRRNHSPTLHALAQLAYIHPGKQTAFGLWRRALEVNPELLDMFWSDAQSFVDEEEFVEAIPEDPYLYARFAELSKKQKVRDLMFTRAETLFRAIPPNRQDFARHHYHLGRIAEIKQDYPTAEEHYGHAVQSDSSATEWRYRYVLVLQKTGQRSRATQQITRCLLQDPANRAYKQKKQDLQGRSFRLSD